MNCPLIPCKYRENSGLDDPTGKSDTEFKKTIHPIHAKILDLEEKVKKKEIKVNKESGVAAEAATMFTPDSFVDDLCKYPDPFLSGRIPRIQSSGNG